MWPGLPRWLSGKDSACQAGDAGSIPGTGRSPRDGNQPTPIFLPEESHGQRSLKDYSPWGHTELDTTGHTNTYTCSKRMGEEEAEAETETNLLRTFDWTEKRDAGAGVKYGANGSLGFGCVCFWDRRHEGGFACAGRNNAGIVSVKCSGGPEETRSRTSEGLIPDIGLITARRAEETGTNSNRIVEGACGSSIHFPSEAQSQVISRQRERRGKGGGKEEERWESVKRQFRREEDGVRLLGKPRATWDTVLSETSRRGSVCFCSPFGNPEQAWRRDTDFREMQIEMKRHLPKNSL